MVFKKWLLRHFIFGPVCFFFCFCFFLPASCGKFRGKLFSFSSVAKVFQSDVLWKRFLLHKQRKLWRFIDLCHERKSVKLPKNINICFIFCNYFFVLFSIFDWYPKPRNDCLASKNTIGWQRSGDLTNHPWGTQIVNTLSNKYSIAISCDHHV